MHRKITEGTKTFTEYGLTYVESKKQLGRETHFTNHWKNADEQLRR